MYKFTMMNVIKYQDQGQQYVQLSNNSEEIQIKEQSQQGIDQFQNNYLQYLRKNNKIIDKDKDKKVQNNIDEYSRFYGQVKSYNYKDEVLSSRKNQTVINVRIQDAVMGENCQHPSQSICATDIKLLRSFFDKIIEEIHQYFPQDKQAILNKVLSKDFHLILDNQRQKKDNSLRIQIQQKLQRKFDTSYINIIQFLKICLEQIICISNILSFFYSNLQNFQRQLLNEFVKNILSQGCLSQLIFVKISKYQKRNSISKYCQLIIEKNIFQQTINRCNVV